MKKDDMIFTRVPKKDKEKLQQIAKEEMRSLSNLVRLIVQKYIQEREN